MLIPSIDLMGGKIVQLVQGRRKALEFDDFEAWVKRFSKYPLVQLIDLDAAIGTGDNVELVREFARQLPCQAGVEAFAPCDGCRGCTGGGSAKGDYRIGAVCGGPTA